MHWETMRLEGSSTDLEQIRELKLTCVSSPWCLIRTTKCPMMDGLHGICAARQHRIAYHYVGLGDAALTTHS